MSPCDIAAGFDIGMAEVIDTYGDRIRMSYTADLRWRKLFSGDLPNAGVPITEIPITEKQSCALRSADDAFHLKLVRLSQRVGNMSNSRGRPPSFTQANGMSVSVTFENIDELLAR